MNYRIHITEAAERDITRAADYIEFVLKNPTAADSLINAIENKLEILSTHPMIYPLSDDSILHSMGIRFVAVNNYLAFYTIDETDRIVYIVRFLFHRQNWISILGRGSL